MVLLPSPYPTHSVIIAHTPRGVEGGGGGRRGARCTKGGTSWRKGAENNLPNTMVYHNGYDKACWKTLGYQVVPMRDFIKRVKVSVLYLPPSHHNLHK